MFIRETPHGIRLTVHVQPGARRSEVAGLHGESLKLRIAAPPQEGAANDELIRFLSELLDLSRSSVQIVSGMRSRAKRVEIHGVEAGAIRRRLGITG